MVTLAALVLLVILLVSNRSLANRIDALESEVKKVNDPIATATAPAAATATPEHLQVVMAPNVAPTPVAPAAVVQPASPTSSDRLVAWLKEDWLMKLGAFIFIIGCGWFVSYAFANNWIGPVGRISLGVIAGALVMALGFRRMLRFPQQGAVFLALGAGMASLAIFAGRGIYDFFTPASAILAVFVIAAFTAYASYQFNLRPLALSAQILAYVAPFLVAGQGSSVFLFSYLLVVSVATLVLAAKMGWRALIVSSLVLVGIHSLPFIFSSPWERGAYLDAQVILNFGYLFAMLYLLSGMAAVVKKGVADAKTEIVLAVMNGALLFLWIDNVAAREWQVLLFAAWAIVFAVSSFVAFRFSSKPDPFYAYGSVAVAFIAAATAAQLDGAPLTIAFTVEAAMLVWAVLALTRNVRAASVTAIVFALPILRAFDNMDGYLSSRHLFTMDFFVLVTLALALIVAGRLLAGAEKHDIAATKGVRVGPTGIILGTVYIWFTIWCFMHVLISAPDMATLATLVVYTVVGLWAYFAGLYGDDMPRRVYGAALLIFVVARLLLIDVWNMALAGRVITFFVIGALLMSTAFLTKKKTRATQTPLT